MHHGPGPKGWGALWRRKWLIAAVILVIGSAGLLMMRLTIGPDVVVYPAVRGDLVKTVVASGNVETPYRVDIGSQITGIVKEVLVDEGQTVKAGQKLIALDATELEEQMVQSQGALAQAEARLRQMSEVTGPAAAEALKQGRANLVNAEATFRRAERLANAGYNTQAALDEATKTLGVAQAVVRAAELQVFTSSPGGSDYVMVETQLHQAQANLASARARLSYATITAPRDGVLIRRSVERGTVVQPGKTLLVLAPDGEVQLVVQIDEKNLGLIRLGQDAIGSADAYPDQRFPARVAYINPAIDITRASVEVKLEVADPPAYLRQDMTVSVDIEVDHRQGALIVPARVVHDPSSDAPFVLAVHEGRARSQRVRLGLRAGEMVEVLEGVAPGDQLIPVAAGVKAGQAVRPVTP
ncbi:efflux RND transporter periplasmic adaptor subunit [Rhodoligotrophos appendicifer]|uniref:efflux RND transporter periplasmic adaptor subunit n=1 Tax=Rhodoligotrophos appendicifer TaxID=987056 RepID=UPI001FE399DD|nr:efflux RND transporter periplasmic adaptor subunit [Rhodoligotrophos appendicifer]